MSVNHFKNTLYLVGVTRVSGPGRQWVGRRWSGMVHAGEASLYRGPQRATRGYSDLPRWLQAGMRVISAKISDKNHIISMIVVH
jgi:hypothetical protein